MPFHEAALNFCGIRMGILRADWLGLTTDLITLDNGERLLVELENAMLTNIQNL